MTVTYVTKRNGELEEVSFDKVINRIKFMCAIEPVCQNIDYIQVAQKVCSKIYDKVTTSELDELAANICVAMSTDEPEYGAIASRIIISNNHKNTLPSFAQTVAALYEAGVVSAELFELSKDESIEARIDYSRDYLFDYFGFKTLEKSYLKRAHGVLERPQHMWMRVALGIHCCAFDSTFKKSTQNGAQNVKSARLAAAFETYDAMSQKQLIHATPTLFHSGTPSMQLLSCFLLGMEDSIEGIYKCASDCAKISKWAGGIGFNVSNIRSRGSKIRGTNGVSDGIVPMLKIFNDTAVYVNQSGKRNGSFAVYIEPWHPDIFDFLSLKKNHGDEAARCRDLFYAIWMPDLFMRRVEAGEMWSLMDPDECPGLCTLYGAEFDALYAKYEAAGKFRSQVSAQKIFDKIIEAQIETGTPYIGYKDAANAKSNQKNLGTIQNSNLCHEIIEYSDSKEYACCTLGSIGLPRFINGESFDFAELARIVKILVRNLNIIIDINYYPVPETRRSNLRHRPIGIGVQGLADVYMKLRVPFDSARAAQLNREIFATIYYSAIEESIEMAKLATEPTNEFDEAALIQRIECNATHLGAYSSFEGSPAHSGQFQFDMWGVQPLQSAGDLVFDWASLRANMMRYGLRNSLLVAPMPTASTSQILGNTECFEPITSNLYVRRTMAGDYHVVNNYLIADLKRLNLWGREMKDQIIKNDGSIQTIAEIPQDVRDLYKTSWDLSMRAVIDQAADRGVYICQTQSMNLFVAKADFAKIRGMHMYAWKRGLKTGIYYLRTMAVAKAAQVTVQVCNRKNKDCVSCSS